ncbi:ThuA domain-containing protein [Actinoplanes sichuanensis]|uniref:ThuA domain-containing protein n=1 Tax=Actinoplanes sichuanensis TaxID=512349 RepID=A0ABW4A4G4_9ACTN|nr:ThuA domain-containing protein [Actinoplanes sichuanensis]BEL03261.1 ThuA domain-containing protein [Actinoplanes sichuanensis]
MNVLIVRGGWDGHQPVVCTELFRELLESHGATITVAETLDVYTDRAVLDATDLIIQCWTRGDLTAEQENGLVDRVRAGAGFAGWHGGVLAFGYAAARYQYMVGGRFLHHPGGLIDHTVDFTGTHPITAGLTSFRVHTEQYYCHVDPSLEVLATTTFDGGHDEPDTAGVVMPVVWIRRFGRGRVFVSTLGHSPADLRIPQTRTLTERGLLWAATPVVT